MVRYVSYRLILADLKVGCWMHGEQQKLEHQSRRDEERRREGARDKIVL